MDDHQFKQLLDWFDLSWDGYYRVRKGVKKRIRKHLLECDCRNVCQYLARLTDDSKLKEQCRVLLTVSISRFFRDRELWQVLEEEILPELLSEAKDRIRVWSAGCARGEEIYSFRILWDVLGDRFRPLPELEAWATDMNQDYLTAAREGIYSASSLKEIPDELKGKYFERLPEKPFFAIRDSVKQGISWRRLDLLKDAPPAENFHIVFLRNNILTYCGKTLIHKALSRAIETLAVGGYLIIGSKEKLPETTVQFRPYAGHSSIFVKKHAVPSS